MVVRLRNKRTAICATLAAVALMLVVAACGGERTSISGAWAGWFNLAGRWEFISVNFHGDSSTATIRGWGIADQKLTNAQTSGSGLLVHDLRVHFELALGSNSDKLVFDETNNSSRDAPVDGTIVHGNDNGKFELYKVNDLKPATFTRYVGDYEEGNDAIFVGYSGNPYYLDGDRLVNVYSLYQDNGAPLGTLYSEMGETLTFSETYGELTGLKLTPRADASDKMVLEAQRVSKYHSEQVSILSGAVTLSGTLLLLPPADGPRPAVVIVPGEGAAERGGEYALADRFARAGIAALIYDKRGVGGSSGDWRSASLGDLGDDAAAAVRFLQGRSEINAQQIGVVGAGQGSWVAGIAAARSPAVRFVIAVSPSGVSPAAQELWRNQNNLRFAGFDDRLAGMAVKALNLTQDIGVQLANGGLTTPDWLRNLGYSAVADLSRNPTALWYRVRQPTLLVYGGLDKLTPPLQSATVISAALRAGGNGNFTVRYFPNANHDLMLAPSGYQHEVLPLDEYAPGYFDAITGWTLARITDKPTPPSDNLPAPDTSVATYVQLPFYGSAWVQLIAMLVFALIFLVAILSFPIAHLVRLRHSDNTGTETEGQLRGMAWVIALLDLLIIGGLVGVLALVAQEDAEKLATVLPILSWLAFITAVLTVILAVASWRTRSFAYGWRRFGQLIFIAAAIAFIPFLLYWNLLGF